MANAGEKVGLSTRQLVSAFKTSHGVSGFFSQGLVPEVFRATWTRFFKFALFPITLEILSRKALFSGLDATSLKVLSAVVSGIPETACIMPFEIAKIQLQLDTQGTFHNSLLQALSSTYAQHGMWRMLSIGFFSVFYRQAAWSAGYFASIQYIQQKCQEFLSISRGEQSSFVVLLAGFIAGVFGTAINTPGDTIRTIIQSRVFREKTGVEHTIFSVVSEIYRNRGISGLYAGFVVKALYLGIAGAMMAYLVPLFDEAVFAC